MKNRRAKKKMRSAVIRDSMDCGFMMPDNIDSPLCIVGRRLRVAMMGKERRQVVDDIHRSAAT